MASLNNLLTQVSPLGKESDPNVSDWNTKWLLFFWSMVKSQYGSVTDLSTACIDSSKALENFRCCGRKPVCMDEKKHGTVDMT